MSRRIIIVTDGSCMGNPGAGGWAAILISDDDRRVTKRKNITGGEPDTTNNRMELMAAIKGLEALKTARRPVTVISDSQYVVKGMTEMASRLEGPGLEIIVKETRREPRPMGKARCTGPDL